MAQEMQQLHGKIIAYPSLQFGTVMRIRHALAYKLLRWSERQEFHGKFTIEKKRIFGQYIAWKIGGVDFTRHAEVEDIFPDIYKLQDMDTIKTQKNMILEQMQKGEVSSEEMFETLSEAACMWTGLSRSALYELKTVIKNNTVCFYLEFKASGTHPRKYDPDMNEKVVQGAKTFGFDKMKIGTIPLKKYKCLFTDPKVMEEFLQDKGVSVISLFTGKPYIIHNKLGVPLNAPVSPIEEALCSTMGTDIHFSMGAPMMDESGRPQGIIYGTSDELSRSVANSILATLDNFSSVACKFLTYRDRPVSASEVTVGFNDIMLSIARTREEEYKVLSDATMRIILNAIAARDKYNPKHSERVHALAFSIAKFIDLSPKEHTLLKQCILHDIGKIAIPDKILNKRTGLSEKEYNAIKTHTREGFETVKNVVGFLMGAWFALYHHENYAWSLYENKKMKTPWIEDGVRVNLLINIVRAADMFDTITSQRPYKMAQTLDYAAEELFLESFSSFDPDVSLAALKSIKKFLTGKEAKAGRQKQYAIVNKKNLIIMLDWYIVLLSRIKKEYPLMRILDRFTDKEISDHQQILKALARIKGCFKLLNAMVKSEGLVPVNEKKAAEILKQWKPLLKSKLG